MTKEDYAQLQKEWESIEFSSSEDFERQHEIEKLMGASKWVFDNDTGEVVSKEES